MIKSALVTVAGIFGLSLPLFAQQIERPNFALAQSPAFFAQQESFFSPFPPQSFFPNFDFADPVASDYKTQLSDRAVSVRVRSNRGLMDCLVKATTFDYATGEVGFSYGAFAGKYSGTSKRAYIMGETGNDHIQISAGASYEDLSVRFPRH